MPLWNPVLLAEQIGTLASIAEGPFVMQTAIGGGAEQFGGMGTRLRGRTTRFEQGLDIVRRLLAGETVTERFGDIDITDARVAPMTPEPLEVWIGGSADVTVTARRASARAGSLTRTTRRRKRRPRPRTTWNSAACSAAPRPQWRFVVTCTSAPLRKTRCGSPSP